MRILITGGAGYIGSHVAHKLIDSNHNVFIVDDLSTGKKILIPKKAKFENLNINNIEKIETIIKNNNFDALMHFAGFIKVEESIKFPKKYFENNTENSIRLFDTCIKNNLKNIIFSSTAAIYGNNNEYLISENAELNPLNPYGKSKQLTEEYLIKNKKNLSYVILRYFNVAGADPGLRSGLIAEKPTHLIKIASEVAIKKREKVIIFGNDYNTNDGTAVRDYIHVSDLAEIHSRTLDFLLEKKESQIFNCGYGKGYSVKEVLDTFNRIHKEKIKIEYGPRREGDAAVLVSSIDKLNSMISWKPKYNKLELIIKSSIDWELKIKNEKLS
tara:strand:+ start:166 stop:1149 length:984 start_codon:yes stop_codon:yes gene_type:complete